MAIQSVAIDPTAQLPETNVDLFVSSGSNAVTTVMVCNKAVFDENNPTDGLTYLTLHLVATGAGVTDTNMIVNRLPVPAGETVTFDTEKIVLENGDRVVASSQSPYNLVATVSTLEV